MNGNRSAGQIEVWTTNAVPRDQAFEYWQDLICDTFVQLAAAPTARADQFRGDIVHATYPSFQLSTVHASGQRVRRTPRLIARAPEESLLASIQIAGRGRVEQDDRVAELRPGMMAFYDSTRPYTLHFDDAFEQIVVQVPKQSVLASGGPGRRADVATAVALGGRGGAGVVASFFRSLSRAAREDPAGAAVLAAYGPSLVSSAINLASGVMMAPETDASFRREQVLAFVRMHYADPTLDIDSIARACHLSRRSLFRLFEASEVAVGDAIRAIRIENAQRFLLEQPHRTVGAIAAACGFAGDAQFHRVFRRMNGHTPASYRHRYQAGTTGE